MKTRGRYKLYATDNSIPVPKVSLWRVKQRNDDEREGMPESDEESQILSANLDKFHNEAIQSIFPELLDDPALTFSQEESIMRDEEFEEEVDEDPVDHADTSHIDVDSPETELPLYAGAKITLATSMILIITFAMRHSLTGEALADLLTLIELHCLAPNLCHTNVKTFKDFFRNLKSPIQFHFYCENCFLYHGMEKVQQCMNCQTPTKKKSSAYFLVIPIISQLSSLLADGTLLEQILMQKAAIQKTDDGLITDVSDGKLYKQQFRRDGYFHGSTAEDLGQLHISFQLNTDGVALFRSSAFSIWPVYFIINELPPHLRFSRNTRLFAGLWFGLTKPDFTTFMKPFAESLHEIFHSGLLVNNMKVRAILLNAVFDAPARCLFQNMTQFNGFYGCPYCHVPGKSVQTSERGHTLSYPFNMDSTNGCHDARSQSSITMNAREAEEKKASGIRQHSVLGVKGLTWFHYLPHFDIVRGVAVDYMHCVMLGVVKMIMSLWFDKTHKNEVFSIHSRISEVDRRLLSIKPPSFVPRLPRTVMDLAHYKAAELKNFLIFYSLPCLLGILPDDQFHHFSLLVYSIYTLLQQEISPDDLKQCRYMLMEFVLNIPVFYGERYSTSNTHLLLHLVDKVEDQGPLWSNSCFYFEDFNGQLRRLFHGTQNIDCQIAFAVSVHQRLPQMLNSLQYGSSELDFMKKLLDKNVDTSKEQIQDGVSMVGGYYSRRLTEEEEQAICLVFGEFERISFFKRLYICHQIVQSREYRNTTRRDNSVVKLETNSFAEVLVFVKVMTCDQCEFFALVKMMNNLDNVLVRNNLLSASRKHMVPVGPPAVQVRAVPVTQISDVCVCIGINNDLSFASVLPNRVEKE